ACVWYSERGCVRGEFGTVNTWDVVAHELQQIDHLQVSPFQPVRELNRVRGVDACQARGVDGQETVRRRADRDELIAWNGEIAVRLSPGNQFGESDETVATVLAQEVYVVACGVVLLDAHCCWIFIQVGEESVQVMTGHCEHESAWLHLSSSLLAALERRASGKCEVTVACAVDERSCLDPGRGE